MRTRRPQFALALNDRPPMTKTSALKEHLEQGQALVDLWLTEDACITKQTLANPCSSTVIANLCSRSSTAKMQLGYRAVDVVEEAAG